MKCLSARWDSFDQDDVRFLIKFLNLSTPSKVFELIEKYYPKRLVPAKTQFFIDEIMETSPQKNRPTSS